MIDDDDMKLLIMCYVLTIAMLVGIAVGTGFIFGPVVMSIVSTCIYGYAIFKGRR